MIPRERTVNLKRYLAACWRLPFPPINLKLVTCPGTTGSVLVQVYINYMVGTMHYSTVIIQYNGKTHRNR